MAADKILKFGIPKGSLEQQTLELMRKSGWRISVDSRSYIPNIDDPALSCRILRLQEMPRYIADGSLDAGITGSDWIVENNVKLEQVESFIYAKATLTPSRWVLCVRENSPVKRLEDLEGKRIATEIVGYVKRTLAQRKVKAEVEFSWGATEAKVAEGIVDAAVDVTETGSSIRANGLRIVEVLLVSNPVLVANPAAWTLPWKQAKIRQIGVLMRGALDAENRVFIKMNVAKENLDKVIALLPSITAPTISHLYPSAALKGKEWLAVETVITEQTVRELFPKLLAAGVVGIVEFPLNKIIG
jgi:ATP phosphoribosyltransferase